MSEVPLLTINPKPYTRCPGGSRGRGSFGALVLFIRPTLWPLIPQRYGVIKVSYD